eukprot:4366448-Prymnesium_polylepis.1
MEPHMRLASPYTTTRTWLQLALIVRAASGALHIIGSRCALPGSGCGPEALAFLFAARALHGLSSNSYAISLAW